MQKVLDYLWQAFAAPIWLALMAAGWVRDLIQRFRG